MAFVDEPRLVDNFVSRRGKSVAGGMRTVDLLSKWETTGVAEDTNQVNKYQRGLAKDFTPDKPWLASDEQFNGGIDPATGQSRRGGSFSRSQLNRRFGGARVNTDPYLPDGTFLDYEFLDNKDDFVNHGKRFEKNYTAGGQGVSRQNGDVNWDEYNRQRAYRAKYVKYYNDGDYSTVEHGVNPVKMAENLHKARFTGLKKLKVFRASKDGRKAGMMPFFERNGERVYYNTDQSYREEKSQRNYRRLAPGDAANAQDYVDNDQDATEGRYSRDNPTYSTPQDVSRAQRVSHASERIMQAFKDPEVRRSMAIISSTLNNSDAVANTQRTTEGFTATNRKLGVYEFGGGVESQNAVESRIYEVVRALQSEISSRKTANFSGHNVQMGNTFIDTKIHEYLGLANRKLGPQEITINLKDAVLDTSLKPGSEVMEWARSNNKSMHIDSLNTDANRRAAKIAHYRDDSRQAMNFKNVHPQTRNSLPSIDGESYGADSSVAIEYKSAARLYDGLKAAFTSEDMEFTEGMTDTQKRSTAHGRGRTRLSALETHHENREHDNGHLNEIGHNTRN